MRLLSWARLESVRNFFSYPKAGLLTLVVLSSVVASGLVLPGRASAQLWNCPDGTEVHGPYINQEAACVGHMDAAGGGGGGGSLGGVDEEPKSARNTCNEVPLQANDNCPFLKDYVVPAINVLAASVGIVVVIMVAWGGLQYTTAHDNPQQAAEAKNHIRNAIMALIIYIFMVAFLNWLVPGGVLF